MSKLLQNMMEFSISGIDLRTIAIYGPRRTGTNYLQQLVLLNTLNCQALQLDAVHRNHHCRLLINGFPEYGSKHSLRDRGIHDKIKVGNINLVILKRDIKAWLNSRLSYQKVLAGESFEISSNLIYKWMKTEYVEFLQDLSRASSNTYRLIFYEDLSLKNLRNLLEEMGGVLTRFEVELDSEATPGGGNTGKTYRPRKIEGDQEIDNFIELNPSLKEIEAPNQIIEWGKANLD